MRKVDKLAMQLAHCKAMCAATYRNGNRNKHNYWRLRTRQVRELLYAELREKDFLGPVPEQEPLIYEDLRPEP